MAISAAEVTFSIPELLEAILLHLGIADILISAQSVSKHWLSVITESTRLQQALFFIPIAPPTNLYQTYKTSPDDDPYSYPNAYRKEIVASFNPLSGRHFDNVFFNLSGCGNFHRANYFYTDLPWWAKGRYDGERNEIKSDDDQPQRRQKAFTRPGASWRRMLVAQPAQPALGYVWLTMDAWVSLRKGYIDSDLQHSRSLPVSEIGLRIGLLYDFVQYHAGHHEYPLWFRVVWGRPYGWEYGPEADKASLGLLQNTSVVVQVSHRNEPDRDPEPADVTAFDHAFRSQDFQLPVGTEVEVYRRPW